MVLHIRILSHNLNYQYINDIAIMIFFFFFFFFFFLSEILGFFF